MSIERVLRFSFDLFRKEPKTALPNVLSWVPSVLFSSLFFQGMTAITTMADSRTIQQILSDEAFLTQIVFAILAYIAVALPILILSVIVSSILSCVYSDIARQACGKRKVMLSQAFSTAKTRFLPLLWTNILQFAIVALGITAMAVLGVVAGVIGILLALIGIFLLVASSAFFFYEVPAIVVLENKSGLQAITRSFEIGKRNLWPLGLIMLAVWIVTAVVSGALGSVPLIGIILSNIAGLFLEMWSSMMPAVFYYEYGRIRA